MADGTARPAWIRRCSPWHDPATGTLAYLTGRATTSRADVKPELREWQLNALTEATVLLAQRGIRAFIEPAAGNPAL
jgi:hypothetical protein